MVLPVGRLPPQFLLVEPMSQDLGRAIVGAAVSAAPIGGYFWAHEAPVVLRLS